MPRLIYTALVLVLLPWALLHLLWRARRQPDYLRHWGERFGLFRQPVHERTIWIHAVSVGETRAAQPLVAALQARYPHHRIVFTHMTPTGRETSTALFGGKVDRVYLPYDTPWATRRFLRHFRPAFGLIMETELWPNLIGNCRAMGIPLLLVNARLSERSARRYRRVGELASTALSTLADIGAQTVQDAGRLQALGAGSVMITGNLKFDIEAPAEMLALGRTLRERCGDRPVWLAASTREGEEALILDAWLKAGPGGTLSVPPKGPTVSPGGSMSVPPHVLEVSPGGTAPGSAAPLLVIVPRHPQRFDEVARLIRAQGLTLQRRSEEGPIAAGTQVLLGDSMGEMFAWYAMADLAFVGGSLLDYGSQNLIEPCAVATPVLIGPSTRNFAEAAREATACGAARAIEDAEGLVREVVRLLAAPEERARMGAAGREFTARHRGATVRTMALIEAVSPAGR